MSGAPRKYAPRLAKETAAHLRADENGFEGRVFGECRAADQHVELPSRGGDLSGDEPDVLPDEPDDGVSRW